MTLQLIGGLIGLGGAVAAMVYVLLTQADDRAIGRANLDRIDVPSPGNEREREMLEPFRRRALLPALAGLTAIGRRLTPIDYADRARRKLVYAGKPGEANADRFLAVRVVSVIGGIVLTALLLVFLPLESGPTLMTSLLVGFVVIAAPDVLLERRAAARQHEMRIRLPDVLDLLVISVEAGLGFEQAIDRTVSVVPGALSEEFARFLGELRAGSDRVSALRGIDERTDVFEIRSFVLALIQADTFGVSIGRVLRSQADEMRIRRRQLAQEEAQKAPVKMLVPMVFCIFPTVLLIVLGPAFINIIRGLSET